jgi:hypothetical protein
VTAVAVWAVRGRSPRVPEPMRTTVRAPAAPVTGSAVPAGRAALGAGARAVAA